MAIWISNDEERPDVSEHLEGHMSHLVDLDFPRKEAREEIRCRMLIAKSGGSRGDRPS